MIDETRVYSKTLAFGLTGVAVFYATMTTYQLMSGAQPAHKWFLAYPIEAISCYGVIPVLMFLATRFSWAKLPAIIYYHIALIIISVWFTEVYSPFTPVWTMYTLVAFIYFGWKGFISSILGLFTMAAWYVFAFSKDLLPSFTVYVILAILVCTITTCTAYLFARVIREGQMKNRALQKSEHSEQQRATQLNALLNSIREPVLTVDANGVITSQNAALNELLNSNQSFIGRIADDIIQLRTIDGRTVKLTELFATLAETMTRDDLVIANSSMSRYVEVQLSRIGKTFNAEDSGVVVLLRDITKQKTLEDEKDEFISVTSHELRTPIAVIEGGIGNIELLRSKHIDDHRFDDALSVARQQISSLARIVNDISTISRAEKGDGGSVEDIQFGQLLIELQNKYKEEAEKRSLVLRLDIADNLPVITTSRVYLTEIIEDFVKNALKYTREGGATIKAGLVNDGRVYCDVIDTGIGINDEDKKRIFEKFYRSEDYRTRETGGTGLGLYEAKILATKIDASIQVASQIDKGSVFRLTLPIKAVKLQLAAPVQQPQPQVAQQVAAS